ncbi:MULTISPECIES: zinc-dependent alcohol dehydrogenase [unclassified Paenibacillus]|uniref:zinc-dependent alcohol dehydrogenase n=1 Tax=unclassified Paenibacillus TaxID=185978 RepID=UPI00041574F0|nr:MULTISPECIES: zinc-binding alcohol dehydrogenase [unclassified Paenibacillus]KGP85155.1 alcohol dehydrogenase [Paenibacillus sp. MAEPY2]KGP88184.1 alcohol dehydrogenase [Paenibacillus sp. MAEPY1]
MKNRKIMFTRPLQVETVEEDFILPDLGEKEVLVKLIYSLISPGTELAMLSGKEEWAKLPVCPGYASVSEVIKVGQGVVHVQPGDAVFHYGQHAEYQVVSTEHVFIKVPEKLDLKWVPFTRMATVAFTSVRVSNIELGDIVGVTGLGLVGNLAAQLARLQGATVIGVDLSPERIRTAQACGVDYTLHDGEDKVKEKIHAITNGIGVSTHIEATGVPSVGVQSLEWIAKLGEIIFLGSPRGEYNTDVTDILNYCHLYGRGCITFKGAHEWRFPVEPNEFVKHSLVRNSNIVFELMLKNKLHIEPLISHVMKPDQAQEAYEGLRINKDQYNGVLFDWS